MKKIIISGQFKRYKLILVNLFFTGLGVIFAPFDAATQIVLHDDPISFKPTAFYIASVIEERPAGVVAMQGVNFKNGAAAAISTYITHNLAKDKSLRPVVISIKELKLTEKTQLDGLINGNLNLHVSFGLQKEYGIEHLIDYQGKLQYNRAKTSAFVIEPSLHNLLKSSLTYFNNWININAGINRKLATAVKISFSNFTETPEGDTIYYATKRPLTWADFQSRIKPATKYQALVMPGIAYDQQAEIVKGIILVQIAMKVFLPKSASWANYTGRDEYTLNHEQRHYDIVKIISETFKQKILAQKLTPDNFEAIINMQYLDTLRDLDAMQNSYDNETSHGLNTSAQSMWNDRIDKRLILITNY